MPRRPDGVEDEIVVPGLVSAPSDMLPGAAAMPIGTKDVGQTETVQRKQDVGRHALPEAFHRLGTGLGDDDVKSSR